MNVPLWISQIILAIIFLLHGWVFLFPPASMVAKFNELTARFPSGFVKFLGIAEIAAGLGLILPWVTAIAPWLTSWAALGLVPIMLGAIVLHYQQGEGSQAVGNGIIVTLLLFVAWGRWAG